MAKKTKIGGIALGDTSSKYTANRNRSAHKQIAKSKISAPKNRFTPGAPKIPVGSGAPGSSGAPGAVAPAPVAPFLTPDQIAQKTDFQYQQASKAADLDTILANLTAENVFQIGEQNRSAVRNTADANDNYAARGLFRSSIRDAGLNDIEASRSRNINRLNDQITTMTNQNNTQKNLMNTALVAMQQVWDQWGVANAAQANTPPA